MAGSNVIDFPKKNRQPTRAEMLQAIGQLWWRSDEQEIVEIAIRRYYYSLKSRGLIEDEFSPVDRRT